VAVQAADSNLDSSEKIYLGGAGGVRAYPSSEAGGSAGRTFSLELRQRLAQTWTLSGFYDYGRVTVNQNNEITPKANPNQLSLQGYGAALAWQGPRGIDISATVAQRIGRNPLANSTTGMDTDGTKQSPRFWLSARFSF
jgi:hemolysin activation/secretion protein